MGICAFNDNLAKIPPQYRHNNATFISNILYLSMPKYKGCMITPSTAKGKKYTAQCGDNPPVHFGASGYRIKPGTSAGDSYCARSQGIEGSGKGSANYWARELWSCRGNKSVSDKPFFGKIKL